MRKTTAAKRELVKALEPNERTTRLSAADAMTSVMSPSIALCYRERLDPARLKQALARVLCDFSSFAGRVQRRDGDLWIDHSRGGAAFEVSESATLSAALGTAVRTQHSALVCPRISELGAMSGVAPLFGARVTQTPDGSVLGLTWNHALGDMHSAALLLRAWVLAYRNEPYEKPIEISDRVAYLAERLPAAPRENSWLQMLPWPAFLRLLYWQLWVTQPTQLVTLEFTPEEMSAIHAAASSDKFVTAHDALCAHIFLRLHRLQTNLVGPYFAIAINFRKRVGLPANLLGNLSDLITIKAEASDTTAAVATALRDRIDTFTSGPITDRDLTAFKASHPSPLQLVRTVREVSDRHRINLILSDASSLLDNGGLVFETTRPVVVHVRGANVPLVGYGVILKSPEAPGVIVNIRLPKRLAKRLANAS